MISRSHKLSAKKLKAPDLDDEQSEAWDRLRVALVKDLARDRVVVFLPVALGLDERLVDTLAKRYPLVFLACSEEPARLRSRAYRALETGVDVALVDAAFGTYYRARQSLLDAENGDGT
jgi:hypothetical protein